MAGDPTGASGGGSAAGKGPRSSTRHQQFRDRAKTRVDDLQEIFFGLQSARKESRSADAAVLEEQVQRRLPRILPTGGPTNPSLPSPPLATTAPPKPP
ncbi:transcription factor VOZ1-like [Hordeum vulgare]|nr:transcription factor VOZ1-like [Hordeum vulgare]